MADIDDSKSESITQEENNRNFFAIIPATVRYNKNLSPLAKLIWAEISCLTNHKGYCYCSNEYLAKCFHIEKNTVSKYINALRKEQLVLVALIRKNNAIVERRIYPLVDPCKGLPVRYTEDGKRNY